jgi:hypothetical protein
MGLEDTLSNVLQWLGDTVAFDPAQEVEAPQPHKDVALYDPILRAQLIEAQRKAHVAMELLCQPTPHQTLVDLYLDGAQEGTECMLTMEVNKTNYHQPDALIPDHPAVTIFLRSQVRTMNHRAACNTVKQAKAFCQAHFNGLDLQVVYHPQEHHCATATWGGRAKNAHIRIIKALPGLFRAQSWMHAQQGQEVLLSQGKVVKASPIIAAQQGSDMQMGAIKEGADITGAVNGTWSSYVLLELLDLLFDGTLSTKVVPRILSGASGNQQGASTEATTDTVLAQPSNIHEAVNPGMRATGAVDPPASATGPVGDGQLVVPTRSGGSATMVDLDLTIPHELG